MVLFFVLLCSSFGFVYSVACNLESKQLDKQQSKAQNELTMSSQTGN